MHKVHTVAEFRHLCYESWRFRIAYASKSEERTAVRSTQLIVQKAHPISISGVTRVTPGIAWT